MGWLEEGALNFREFMEEEREKKQEREQEKKEAIANFKEAMRDIRKENLKTLQELFKGTAIEEKINEKLEEMETEEKIKKATKRAIKTKQKNGEIGLPTIEEMEAALKEINEEEQKEEQEKQERKEEFTKALEEKRAKKIAEGKDPIIADMEAIQEIQEEEKQKKEEQRLEDARKKREAGEFLFPEEVLLLRKADEKQKRQEQIKEGIKDTIESIKGKIQDGIESITGENQDKSEVKIQGIIGSATVKNQDKTEGTKDSITSKIGNGIKNIFGKAKEAFNKITGKDKNSIKLLGDGLENTKGNALGNVLEDKAKSFRENLSPESYISESYTKENAQKALDFAKNPLKYIQELNAQKAGNAIGNNTKDNDNQER